MKTKALASRRMSPNRVVQTVFDCVVQYSVVQVAQFGTGQ